RLSCRMASARRPRTPPVPRHRPRSRQGGTPLARRQNRALRSREGKEGDQALGRRPQGHELRRPCCPSRHLHAQHHARANKPATPLHPLSPTNPTPRGRLQADRHRPRPCPVTKNTDCQINQSDQSLAPPPNENFGLRTYKASTEPSVVPA